MIAPKRQQNAYDHRLRELVFRSGRTETARQIGLPRSTIHGWTKARPRPVVTLTAKGDYVEDLEKRVYLLERRTARLRALLRLCIVLSQIFTGANDCDGTLRNAIDGAVRRLSSS